MDARENGPWKSGEDGKLTDLLVIDGDPIGIPVVIRNLTLVFKDGVRFNPEPMIDDVEGGR